MEQWRQELTNIEIPDDLHERSKIGVKQAKMEMDGKIKRLVKKRFVEIAIAVALIIPTGAFAYQALLVDEVYGSFENIKKHISTATMQGYLLLDAKLTQAKGDLGEEDYTTFKELLKVIATAKLEYGDEHGNIDYSLMPKEKFEEVKEVMFQLQPYFDVLNDLPSSKEVLTPLEYEEYIHTLITYQQILVESGIDGSSEEMDKVPAHLQVELAKAQAFLMYVNDKQMKSQ